MATAFRRVSSRTQADTHLRTLCAHVGSRNLRAAEKSNQAMLQAKGELSEAATAAYEKARKLYERLMR